MKPWLLIAAMLAFATPAAADEHASLAICYGPHRDGQRPGGDEPSADQLAEDLAIIAKHWSHLRIYGSTGVAPVLLATIRELGLPLQVMVGVWIGLGTAAKYTPALMAVSLYLVHLEAAGERRTAKLIMVR